MADAKLGFADLAGITATVSRLVAARLAPEG